MLLEGRAVQHSAECFLNSYLRDLEGEVFPEALPSQLGFKQGFCISLRVGKLWIPLRRFSRVGRHQYESPFWIENQNRFDSISFFLMARLIVEDWVGQNQADPSKAEAFLERVENSCKNISLYLNAKEEIFGSGLSPLLTFEAAEQALVLGHNFHPTPKSKDQLSDEDQRSYSPELGAKFSLEWLLVDPELLIQRESNSAQSGRAQGDPALKGGVDSWLGTFPASEGLNQKSEHPGYIPFPVHPWQKKNLLQHPDFRSYLESGRIVELGPSTELWYATSSFRSLYRPGSQFMVKFSLSLKITNSIRNLLIPEVERSLLIHDVFESPKGKEFLERHPHFKVIYEPGYAVLKDSQGEAIQESLVLCRENPFMDSPEVPRMVLATLTQSAPFLGENLVVQLIQERASKVRISLSEASKQWFTSYLDRVLTPLVRAQSDYGILLGAHQQNLILELDEGLPSRTYFRDCQGTAFTPLGKRLFAGSGLVFDQESSSHLFTYYIIINSTFNVIAAIAQGGGVSEDQLLTLLREHLSQLKSEGPEDPSCLEFLVSSATLQQKGNFFCCLKNINENTASDPLSIYRSMRNPIFQPKRPPAKSGTFYQKYYPDAGMSITLRTADVQNDLETFYNWHHQARVSRFWELAKPIEELKVYLENGLEDPHQIPVILEADGKPVGYAEIYWALEDRIGPYYDADLYDRGFHFLIGDENFRGSENTRAAITAVCHAIFLDDSRTQRIVAEPRYDNDRILRFTDGLGWRRVKIFDFPHKRAVLLEYKRDDFFKNLVLGATQV